MGATLNFLTQYKEDGNDLLKRIITDDEVWIHFYWPERNQRVWFGEKKGISAKEIQECAVFQVGDVSNFLGLLQLGVHWIWSWWPLKKRRHLFWYFNAFGECDIICLRNEDCSVKKSSWFVTMLVYIEHGWFRPWLKIFICNSSNTVCVHHT